MSFLIWFLSNDYSFLYLAMKNVYSALIIRFASRLTIVSNQKLHTAVFYELFHLVSTFFLPPSNNFQLSLHSFLKLLPNPHEAIVAFKLVLKSPMLFYVLDPSYYTLAEIVVINKAIATTMSEFVVKATDNKNKHLWYYVVCLIEDLELLQSLYLTEYNLMSIALIVRSSEQVCLMSKQFDNLLLARYIPMIYIILNKEKTCLHYQDHFGVD